MFSFSFPQIFLVFSGEGEICFATIDTKAFFRKVFLYSLVLKCIFDFMFCLISE